MDHHNSATGRPGGAGHEAGGVAHEPGTVDTVICDLDGVIWLEGVPIGGSVAAVEGWREMGCRVLFVTNNSTLSSADHEARLAAIGISADGDVVSSCDAAASMVEPGESVMVLGGTGIVSAVSERGARVVDPGLGPDSGAESTTGTTRDGAADARAVGTDGDDIVEALDATPHRDAIDAVVVGLDRRIDYRRLAAALTALKSGARFIATNEDPVLPTPSGPVPGAGSIVAAVAAASGRLPIVAGKPHDAIVAVIRERLGPDFDPGRALVIGDQRMTDGVLAQRLQCRFALVSDEAAISTRDHGDDASARQTERGDRGPVDGGHDASHVSTWLEVTRVHDVMVACRSLVGG